MEEIAKLLEKVPPCPWTIVSGDDNSVGTIIRGADGKTVVYSMRSPEVAELIVASVNFVDLVSKAR